MLALCAVLAVIGAPARAFAGDPYLRFWTISTPHFRVHYHEGLEPIAERAASIAERAHRLLVPHVSGAPDDITNIVLVDDSDAANGIASARPYNSILLYVTAPEDMSPLNDYDDWQVELITHEYTHILEINNYSGIPSIVNAVLGKVMTPNQFQPRWILEGLAVAMESAHSTAGRLRNTQFDMFLRADVLEGRMATLDEFSHAPRRWPGGNIWYLYGAKFIEWILEVYGKDTYASVLTHYGRWPIAYGINRAIRRVTGRTYPELYAGWKASVEQSYGERAAAIRARGVREGIRLTSHGRAAYSARYVPAACQRGREPELLYYRDDYEQRPGFYRISALPGKAETSTELVARANKSVATFAPDCSLVFETTAPSARRHFFSDLFRLPAGVHDPSGLDARRERLTVGLRAREPAVSPDGRRIAYVTNDRGTTTLRLADFGAGGISNSRVVVPSARFEQVFTPRFSPDGKKLAYSVWTQGGNRDIRVVDLEARTFRNLTSDRAIDQQPTFSPDSRAVYFTSDRTGVPNVYAYDLERGTLRQVTNVLTGAYMPEVSPDGKTIVYSGYTAEGFDLYLMPLDARRFLDALPPPPRERHVVSVTPARWPRTRYNPLPTLRPRSLNIDFGTGTFGDSIQLTTSGGDAVGQHGFTASLLFQSEGPSWLGTLDYVYARLPFDLHMTLSRGASPRADYRIGERNVSVVEERVGLTTGVAFDMPGTFDGQSAGFSYSLFDFDHEGPVGTRGDPWSEVPFDPDSGLLASVRAAYSFTAVEGSAYGISAERGYVFGLGVDFAHPALGSEETLTAFTGSFAGYVPMPYHPHHVAALALSAGVSSGSYPRRGLFSTGGFVDQPAFDVYTSGIQQSAFVLRGYDPGQFVGTEYVLANAEYRFPILYVDRGLSTLPIFLNHLSGTVFTDFGGAFFGIDHDDPLRDLHHSVGAELWIQAVLGYRIGGNLRLGIARTLGEEENRTQTYFVAASAF